MAVAEHNVVDLRSRVLQSEVLVPAEELVECLATFQALVGVLQVMAGDACPTPIDDQVYARCNELERLLGVTWADDAHQTDPVYVKAYVREHLIQADLCERIVDDLDDCFTSGPKPSRRRFAGSMERCRQLAQEVEARGRTY
jgi:hypothetical protein